LNSVQPHCFLSLSSPAVGVAHLKLEPWDPPPSSAIVPHKRNAVAIKISLLHFFGFTLLHSFLPNEPWKHSTFPNPPYPVFPIFIISTRLFFNLYLFYCDTFHNILNSTYSFISLRVLRYAIQKPYIYLSAPSTYATYSFLCFTYSNVRCAYYFKVNKGYKKF
jgi:hypothetical protein